MFTFGGFIIFLILTASLLIFCLLHEDEIIELEDQFIAKIKSSFKQGVKQ